MTDERPGLMRVDDSICVLVDHQPRLMAAIHDGETVLREATRLAEIAAELEVPVVGTAQNPDRLGGLPDELASRCAAMLDKMSFGAGTEGLTDLLHRQRPGARQVVIAGCETHVCLLQTALQLLAAGYQVFVVTDASGSRSPHSAEVAVQRLQQAGAVPVTVEMVGFEWLGSAANPHFKAVQSLIK